MTTLVLCGQQSGNLLRSDTATTPMERTHMPHRAMVAHTGMARTDMPRTGMTLVRSSRELMAPMTMERTEARPNGENMASAGKVRRREAAVSAPRRGFVLLACGDRYVDRVNAALRYLKRATRHDIVVLRSRSLSAVNHDQIIECAPPNHFTDREACVSLKTNVHRILGNLSRSWCYLDSDIIVLNSRVDRVFDHLHGEVAFARDHVNIDALSQHIVKCGCADARCNHLRQEIQTRFNVHIPDGRWIPWNGGMFAFGPDSFEFLDQWHEYAGSTLSSGLWHSRDQGSLAATVWKMGLQRLPPLPRRYNRIVDGLNGVDADSSRPITPSQLIVDRSYRLEAQKTGAISSPVCLHFINDTVGKRGWKNWDDVEAMLEGFAPCAPTLSNTSLSSDNKVVHSLWIGDRLSKLELLTLESFVRHGHEFHLWLYDDLVTPLPKEIVIEDAAKVIPRRLIFKKRSSDLKGGVGAQSYGPFSDLFRYKALYEKGGYWADMDVTCLRPFNIPEPYLFRAHRIGVMGNIMKCPQGSGVMERAYQRALASAGRDSEWLLPNRILSTEVRESDLSHFVRSNFCNEDEWQLIVPMLEADFNVPKHWYGIHWLNEMHRTIRKNGGEYLGAAVPFIPNKDNPKRGSLLARLYAQYGLDGAPRTHPRSGQQDCSRIFWNRGHQVGAHMNVVLPTLNTGGAERIVLDIVAALPTAESAQVLILGESASCFDASAFVRSNVTFEALHGLSQEEKLRLISARVLASPNPLAFVHMPDAGLISGLQARGISTIPVVHNLHQSWQTRATSFNVEGVPFVVAVCEAVASELRAFGCRRRIEVVRHEVDRGLDDAAWLKARREVRLGLDLPSDTVLVGMVGQFKKQKNYARAVRILHGLRTHVPARLAIIGSWDTDPLAKECYDAVCRQSLTLGLNDHVHLLGKVFDVERYLAAFDVFLNTSEWEGLSISMLEAERAGCPIVASDVGGTREIKTGDRLKLISPNCSDDHFIRAILSSLDAAAGPPAMTAVDGLIPFVWSALANYGCPAINETDRGVRVYLTNPEGLRQIANGLLSAAASEPLVAGVCGVPPLDLQESLQRNGVEVKRLPEGGFLRQAAASLALISSCRAYSVYLAGVDVPLRLILAKILPPETEIIDLEAPDVLSTNLAVHRNLQHRLCLDASDYYARLHMVRERADWERPQICE
jgi:glycosyltransferase involved in cell wall biosynthesis